MLNKFSLPDNKPCFHKVFWLWSFIVIGHHRKRWIQSSCSSCSDEFIRSADRPDNKATNTSLYRTNCASGSSVQLCPVRSNIDFCFRAVFISAYLMPSLETRGLLSGSEQNIARHFNLLRNCLRLVYKCSSNILHDLLQL